MENLEVIGFGGGCHWCNEAVFQSVIGVARVEQGWIAPADMERFSEGVLVHFDAHSVSLELLVAVHLHSHSAMANHSMREKYRSAVYVFNEPQGEEVRTAMVNLENEFDGPLVTQILGFGKFQLNDEKFLDYYLTDMERPFCRNYISPKLEMLRKKFVGQIRPLTKEN